ncbi:NAD(P)-dependent dehydrogenase, short-chain alcohol dehydrogenase family [Dyadobacter soli]|uniref:NAD(P)-dependent dehydrogenase, short-chain alcohol dehydrogenase family n=1 Tax=Dyadobacter soli TaxID=659014 RepID=A0A1G7M1Y0_9BACT|nr:SDR family NAD(P)-dependent oxidoreductase [Dyadobacter soli]SDF55180.1 NAD(P)-dependent dehydrogenase, short-chain alcohol dehydrogenase family [Dyadobacter soli]
MKQNNFQGTLQHSIGSGFDRNSTAAEVIKGIDLTGKTAIVTGGHSGLGLELTKTLAGAGANVIVGARDISKAGKNLANIPSVELVALELTDAASIERFAAAFVASGRPLHLLFNNAGIMWVPLAHDPNGYESHFATNHLGHFHLTARLWPALKQANGARVINTSSWGHHASPIVFEDPHFENRAYDPMQAYGQSKTANVLFALELDERGKAFGVRSYSVHPGLILSTDLGRSITLDTMKILGMADADGNMVHREYTGTKTVEQGISTLVWCATSPLLENLGGVYCENTDIAELDTDYDPSESWSDDTAKIKGVMQFALDEDAARKLWSLSEELTGVRFDVV